MIATSLQWASPANWVTSNCHQNWNSPLGLHPWWALSVPLSFFLDLPCVGVTFLSLIFFLLGHPLFPNTFLCAPVLFCYCQSLKTVQDLLSCFCLFLKFCVFVCVSVSVSVSLYLSVSLSLSPSISETCLY